MWLGFTLNPFLLELGHFLRISAVPEYLVSRLQDSSSGTHSGGTMGEFHQFHRVICLCQPYEYCLNIDENHVAERTFWSVAESWVVLGSNADHSSGLRHLMYNDFILSNFAREKAKIT